MGVRILSRSEVIQRSLQELGLGAAPGDLSAPEALACSLRRVAGMYCPTSRAALLRAVTEPLEDLVDEPDVLAQRADDVLEAVIAHGDLLELPEVAFLGERPRTLVYAAPPAFVVRESGAVLLLGIAGEQVSLLPPEIERLVEHHRHVRHLPAGVANNIAPHLEDLGLTRLSERAWLDPPTPMSARGFIERFDRALEGEPEAGPIEGLRTVDPRSDPDYYRGRWTEVTQASGHLVGRRPQRFGADLWCYVALEEGQPRRFLDLPLGQTRYRACDEAWRLQAAIDATNGKPQRLRIRPGPAGRWIFNVFAPLPMWLARRWDAVGDQAQRSPGALLSYAFDSEDLDEEASFACDMMWLAVDRAT